MHTCVVLNIHLIAFGVHAAVVLTVQILINFDFVTFAMTIRFTWIPMVKLNVHVRFAVQRFVHKYWLNNALCLWKATTSRIYCCPRIKTQFELFQRTSHCVLRRLQMRFQTVLLYMLYISKLQISKARLYTN